MEQQKRCYSNMYNGFVTLGDNYVWSGAMCLAWTQLKYSIIKQPIQLVTKQPQALKMIENFNFDRFKRNDIDQKSVYIKSGYGKQTLDQINLEVQKKFPSKKFQPLEIDMKSDSIISYAYLLKKIEFNVKFTKITKNKILFNTKLQCDGFYASQARQRKQISCISYENQDNFAISIKGKNPNDYICLIKSQQDLSVQIAIEKCQGYQNSGELNENQQFAMPIVDFDFKRSIKQLKLPVKNQQFSEYTITEMMQNIKFRVDQQGAKVENEAVVALSRCIQIQTKKRSFLLDKPFWVVMMQSGKHPYLVAYINNPIQEGCI